MFRYDTYCGIFCGACGMIKATEFASPDDRACTEGTDRCHGCKSDLQTDYCNDCKIKNCAEGKGLEFCFECDDFPCEALITFENDRFPHHSGVLKNLDSIRKDGLASWISQQTRRWQCPECGKPFTWYEKACTECGIELQDCHENIGKPKMEEG